MRTTMGRTCVFLLLLLTAAFAGANTISFVPASSGSLGVSQQAFSAGGATVTATSFYFNGSAWAQGGVLFGRNDGSGSEQGLGVCSPNEISSSSCYSVAANKTGGGDVNELSNENQAELIRLTLPAGYNWTSFQVSSLDNNGSGPYERGMVWAGSNATPTGAPGALSNEGASAFCTFIGSNPVGVGGTCTILSGSTTASPTFSVPASLGGAQYIFFEAYNWQYPSKTNNDYLVKAASVSATPEPASLMLFGTGLLGFAGLSRRKRSK